jgi:hypothetical protein
LAGATNKATNSYFEDNHSTTQTPPEDSSATKTADRNKKFNSHLVNNFNSISEILLEPSHATTIIAARSGLAPSAWGGAKATRLSQAVCIAAGDQEGQVQRLLAGTTREVHSKEEQVL